MGAEFGTPDSEPPDIGDTVRKALNCHKRDIPIERVIFERDQGNGSLMRCLPLAFLSYENESDLRELEAQIDQLSRLEWRELPSSGWVIHSLGCIGWALRSELSFEDNIVAIANRGDDADTNAALVAAAFS
jgi:ADP-ribosylglycohydrolase